MMKSNLSEEDLEFQVRGMLVIGSHDEYGFERLKEDAPDVVYDIGANVGGITTLLSELFPCSVVVAVEPVDENYSLLVKNTQDCGNVVTVNAALCVGRAWVCKESSGIGNWLIVGEQSETFDPTSLEPCKVQTVTLDELHRSYGGEKYAVKLDCESGEMMFLKHRPSEEMLLCAYYIAGEFHLWARTAEQVPGVFDSFLRWVHKLSKTHNVEMQLFENSAKLYALRRA